MTTETVTARTRRTPAGASRQADPNAPARVPVGCTNLKLRQLTRRVSRFYDAEMAHCGLKTTQYSLLACIDSLGPLAPGAIARRLCMDPSTLTRNLRPLEDAGWIRVETGPDARSHAVGVTEAGHAKRAEARTHWKRAQRALNRLLGEARVAMFHDLLDDLQSTLDATGDATRDPQA